MAGTIFAKLLATHQADNTAITAANSGFSTGGSAGAGNTAVHLDAAKMGASEGYRLVQAANVQSIFYLDDTVLRTKWAFRTPLNISQLPAVTSTLLRGYTEATHTTGSWALSILANGKLQFVESGTGTPLSVTSAAALVPGTDYVIQGLVDIDTDVMTINVFPRGSSTAAVTLTGTLVNNLGTMTMRYGIVGTGGAATGLTQDTNDAFAIGYGDFLPRADIAGATITQDKTTGPIAGNGNPATVINYTVATDDTSGATKQYAVCVEYSANGLYTDTVVVKGQLADAGRTYQTSPSFTHTPTGTGKYRARGYVLLGA